MRSVSMPEIIRKPTRREIADTLKRASAFMFFRYRYSMTFELGLESWGSRRADVIGNKISGDIVIVEIKSSLEDFKQDHKFQSYLPYCDRMYFAFTKDVALKINKNPELMARIPSRVGILVLSEYGYMRVVKKAKIVPVELSARMLILARLAWRQGELSKRTTRARQRVYLPGAPELKPLPKPKRRRRFRIKRRR